MPTANSLGARPHVHRNIQQHSEPPFQRIAQAILFQAVLDAFCGPFVASAKDSLRRAVERRDGAREIAAMAPHRMRHRSKGCPVRRCAVCEYLRSEKAVGHAELMVKYRSASQDDAAAFLDGANPAADWMFQFWTAAAGWDPAWFREGVRRARAKGVQFSGHDLERLLATFSQPTNGNGNGHHEDPEEE